MTRAVALIDGEHYAEVVVDAFEELPYEVVGAVALGGQEKLRGDEDYGVPLFETLEEGLERVDAALVAVVSKPDGLAELEQAVDLLTDTLLSHLSYEERELVEPLARLPLRI